MKPEQKKYILDNVNQKSIKDISRELNLKERKIRKFLEEQKTENAQKDSQKETIPPHRKKTILLSVILIIVLGFTVYNNSLNNVFFWDDRILIEENEYITSWSYILRIFTKDIGGGAGKQYTFYRPFQIFTYMIDYSIWGLNARGYHFTNIVLHITAALSIFWLINIVFKDNFLSLLTGAFFVVHPIHTEAVTYISGRADSLALVFALLCVIFYVKSLSYKRSGAFCLMVLSYVFALLSKENSLILI